MRQKDNIILVPIIFSAITSYVIYDVLSAFWETIYMIVAYEYNTFYLIINKIAPFIMCIIFPFFSACSSILIINKLVIRKKQIPISSFVVSLVIGIIIFIVTKLFCVVVQPAYIDNSTIFQIAVPFGYARASTPRNILFSVLVGIGEFIILKSSQITPENISMPQSAAQPVADQINFTNTTIGGQTMFCRNCGNMMGNNAVVCVNCGAAKGSGNSYCPNCGKETNPNAAFCLNCGCALTNTNIVVGENAKSKLVAGLLAIFLGGLGIHNFYLGYNQKGVIQLLITLLGSCLFFIGPIVTGIWALIEAIFIFTGKINVDGNGNPLKD